MIIREAGLADASGIARVRIDAWRTAYRDLLPQDFLSNLSYEKDEAWHRRIIGEGKSIYLVAESETGGIVGFVNAGAERSGDPAFSGELYAIYLLDDYRRCGIGSALVRRAVAYLRSVGFPSMLVWVFAANPARCFYEKLGGEYIRSQAITVGDVTLDEVAYGWRDLTVLVGRPT